jgi:Asp-tRNA(Asn)/Glu-tRNA(Gln) amidotransferase A subunit family amidase
MRCILIPTPTIADGRRRSPTMDHLALMTKCGRSTTSACVARGAVASSRRRPVGMQLVGRPFAEDVILRLATRSSG